ncbi:hypothetical protein ACJX0J_029887, partial [Zea mays]
MEHICFIQSNTGFFFLLTATASFLNYKNSWHYLPPNILRLEIKNRFCKCSKITLSKVIYNFSTFILLWLPLPFYCLCHLKLNKFTSTVVWKIAVCVLNSLPPFQESEFFTDYGVSDLHQFFFGLFLCLFLVLQQAKIMFNLLLIILSFRFSTTFARYLNWIVEFDNHKYTPAIDIWSVGCIFAELLTGKPLFPGKNVVHQLDLMTDLLGTPSAESISKIRNEKARRYMNNMRKKPRVPFTKKFPGIDPMALHLLERLLAFDPKERPSAAEALADPYFNGLANNEREPIAQPISKLEFEFEKRKLAKDDVRELIYREILEYHPQMLQEYLQGADHNQMTFMYPSGVDRFRRQFAHLEEGTAKGEKHSPQLRQNVSLPRERVIGNKHGDGNTGDKLAHASVTDGISQPSLSERSFLKSESISASKCIGEKPKHVKD